MEDFKIRKIYKTEDYDQFKELPSNRPIKESQVKRLIKLIQEENKLSDNPIWINREYKVLDGQHRLIAAKKLSLPIYFEFKEGDLKDAKVYNIGRIDWSPADFLYSYCKENNPHYLYLRDFMSKYQLTLGVSLRLLGMHKDRSNNTLVFKTGKFKPDQTTKFHAELLAERLLDLRPYLEKNVWSASEFIHALKKVYGKVGHDELLRKLSYAKYRIPVYKRQIDYIRALADVYNFGRQNRVNFE